MKRKLFIGSSSEEKSITVAKKLKTKIIEECGEWIEPYLWSDKKVFLLNKSTYHNLLESARKYEYGIFVANVDDMLLKKYISSPCARDNVLLEAGMFLGSLGWTRAFLLADTECNLPSDYAGITVSLYNNTNLDSKISEITDALKDTEKSYKFSIVPSTALAVGYFDNFVKQFSEKQKKDFRLNILIPKNIADIHNNVEKHYKNTKSKILSSVWKKPLHKVYKYPSKELWDIPTTLTTLNTVIDKISFPEEIGINVEKEEWIQHEVRNFMETLQFLISQNCKCIDNVIVKYLDD